jgi:hypothetical protein
MSVSRADFDTAKKAVMQAVSDAATRVAADIQALRDQIAAGNPVTDADLADLQADAVEIGQIDPPAPPTPTPTP